MMQHEEAKSLLAVHALHAIDDPEEIDELERHVATCPECRDELDRHRAAAAALAEGTLGAPPSLWRRIQTDIEVSPSNEHATVTPLSTRATGRWLAVAAVASLLAAASLAGLLTSARADLTDLRQQVVAMERELGEQRDTIEALSGDPIERAIDLARSSEQSLEVDLVGEIGHGAAVIRDDGHGWLTDIDFQPLDDSRTYQLWAIQDGVVISAGVLGPAPNTVSFHVDFDRLDGLVITIERAGGVVSSENGAAAAWLQDA